MALPSFCNFFKLISEEYLDYLPVLCEETPSQFPTWIDWETLIQFSTWIDCRTQGVIYPVSIWKYNTTFWIWKQTKTNKKLINQSISFKYNKLQPCKTYVCVYNKNKLKFWNYHSFSNVKIMAKGLLIQERTLSKHLHC